MKTLAIKDRDIFLDENGNIAVATELDGVANKCTSLLQTIQGEWILDKTVGIPYLTDIFTINIQEATVRNIFDNAILTVPDVTGIVSSSTVLDRITRRFAYAARIQTIHGQTEITTNG